MAAATHILGSSSSSSSVSPPPWHPVLLIPSHHQVHHHHQVLYDDLDLATPSGPSPFPFPTTPAATRTASPPRHNHNHNHLRPASSSRHRAAGKQPRRPRLSRKLLTTTYISADAASFRRMVHQVTGFDDDVHLHGGGGHVVAAEPELLLCRQAPAPLSHGARALATMETEMMLLPTLDTSAFLMLGASGGGGGGAAPARPPGVSSCCHGSAVVGVVDPGAAAAALQVKAEEACGGGGLASLESWDEEDDALDLLLGV